MAIDSYGGMTGTVFMGTISPRKNLGTNLTNTHPIGVLYPTSTRYNQPDAVTGNIVDPVETPAGQSAHLEDGRVQCTSCHYAHGSRAAYGMFLRVDNTGSALCMTCHIGPGCRPPHGRPAHKHATYQEESAGSAVDLKKALASTPSRALEAGLDFGVFMAGTRHEP